MLKKLFYSFFSMYILYLHVYTLIDLTLYKNKFCDWHAFGAFQLSFLPLGFVERWMKSADECTTLALISDIKLKNQPTRKFCIFYVVNLYEHGAIEGVRIYKF